MLFREFKTQKKTLEKRGRFENLKKIQIPHNIKIRDRFEIMNNSAQRTLSLYQENVV